ncbi:hypothetical protein [Aquihabitans sp. McL0605]|uniref:hypothetical protein n=1 Tax=Aquihabitans sp. McL0605 TaxID=3415671 RepID=UPI003CEC9AFA
MPRRLWNEDRWALGIVAVATAVHAVAWGFRTAPMGDSAQYRADGLSIVGGWHHLTDRAPGYPLVLWATGSLHRETVLLFVLQAILHAGSVLLVVDVAWRLGVSRVGRAVVAGLLVVLPAMVLVRSSGSEAISQFLVVVAVWAVVRWLDDRSSRLLVVAGAASAAGVWVRPSMALVPLVLAVAVTVSLPARRSGPAGAPPRRPRVRAAALVLGPAVLAFVLLVGIDAVRFDRPEASPLTGWYLSSRTSTFVDELPPRYEPGRSILVAERDRQLLLGDRYDAPNYAFSVRDDLGAALGRDRAGTDRWMLDANLYLITHHPLEYVASIGPAVIRFTDIDSQPAVQGLGTAATWVLQIGHLLLLSAFALQAVLAPGILLSERGRPGVRRRAAGLALCVLVVAAVAAPAVLLETGAARLRSPVDPLLALLLVAGWEIVGRAIRRPVPPT